VCGEASDGEQGIAKAKELQPTVIIVDYSMPGMNGVTTAKHLRETVPQAQLLLFSAFGNLLTPERLNEVGFSAVVSKSEPDALIPEIRRLLEAAT
jgi:DNA-binding NarL/FixJ family response regulator